MRRRRFLLGLLALPAGWAIWSVSRNRLVVTNESDQLIRFLTVEVCGRTIRLGDVPPGGSVSARFGTPADDDVFVVRGRLEDGTVISESCGYVVWEDHGRRFDLVILPGGRVTCR
jgi:hypothetical protein